MARCWTTPWLGCSTKAPAGTPWPRNRSLRGHLNKPNAMSTTFSPEPPPKSKRRVSRQHQSLARSRSRIAMRAGQCS
ncbi:Uncharacterised protein [Mycobacteroides abscessus subsp. abscessus]|nr:Uncharacterised protein [Mycobacteroides abscessus subsp. abscessus]